MIINYSLTYEQICYLTERIQVNHHQKLAEKEDILSEEKIGLESGDRFYKGSIDLLYLVVNKTIDFHKSITDTYRGEKYIQDFT